MPTESPDVATLKAELDGLTYAISHDLRAPARAITGFAQALREQLQTERGAPLQGDTHRFLERVEESISRLQQMLDGLLMLSRLSQQSMHPQPVLLKTLCQSAIEQLSPERRAIVELDVDPQLQAVVDPALLGMALHSLLDNACKFTSLASEPTVRIRGTHDASCVTLCVIDNGLGFDMQYAARLGVPFQHLHARKELLGVGLGLAVVRRVAMRHAGKFWAESQPGQGSQFYLQLPATRSVTS